MAAVIAQGHRKIGRAIKEKREKRAQRRQNPTGSAIWSTRLWTIRAMTIQIRVTTRAATKAHITTSAVVQNWFRLARRAEFA